MEENGTSRQKIQKLTQKSEAKANLLSIVVYALEKKNVWTGTHLSDCLEADSLSVCCREGRQRAREGKEGQGVRAI